MKISFQIIALIILWILFIKIIEFKIGSVTPNILRGGVHEKIW